MGEQRLLDMWLPPEGAGEPVACLATSFTFNTDFFRDDCLSRFLGLRGVIGEESGGLLAQVSELEEALAEVQVSVLVDRSARVEGRNLRWDVLSCTNPGGLLHAKTSLLMWRNLTRVIIGSANMTAAGYRYQREIAVAYDLGEQTALPRQFWDDYRSALKEILELAPQDLVEPGPKSRAAEVINELDRRLDLAEFPRPGKGSGVHLISARPGTSVTDQLAGLIRSPRPYSLRALSPFWDGEDQGSVDAVRALTQLLTARGDAEAQLMVPLAAAPDGSVANAPRDLPNRACRKGVEVSLLGVTDDHNDAKLGTRRLHAKALSVESEDYRLTMIGSSNMTSSGLGLHPSRGHYEMNVCYVSPRRGALARELDALFPDCVDIDQSVTFTVVPDIEDEPAQPALPSGFLAALLKRSQDRWVLLLALQADQLPPGWSVATGVTSQPILTAESYSGESQLEIGLDSEVLPQALLVKWTDAQGASWVADWVLNVANPADLPLDERLRAIPIDLIVQVLAQGSRNPVAALERLLERLSVDDDVSHYEDLGALDPLKAFDDSRALLRRIRTYSRALDQLADRLSRPAPTLSALGWRLSGLVSPTRLAEGWVEQTLEGHIPVEMAHFLVAEMLLVVNRTDWDAVTQGLDQELARRSIQETRSNIEAALAELPPLNTENPLAAYVDSARSAR